MFKIDVPNYLVLGGLALVVASATGCSKDESSGEATAAKATAGNAAAVDLGAINGAVPEGFALTFASAVVDDEVDAVVPEGWEASKVIPGKYAPPPDSDLGFFTKYSVGATCDGLCAAKDWDPVVAEGEFGQQLEGATVDKDEKLDAGDVRGRLVVATDGDRKRVIAAWWKKGASRYFFCRAELDGKARDAVAAFESACRATRPRW